MKVPIYTQWRHVLLDTTILINLILLVEGKSQDETVLFVNQLITDLGKRGKKAGPVTFYVSTVSVCEILGNGESDKTINRIVSALGKANVEFLGFDLDVSVYFAKTYHSYLSNKALNNTALRIGWSQSDLINAREWISKDLMIIATGACFNCDVILTTDVRTLYPIAQEVGFPCALAYPRCFNVSGTQKYIFEYHEDEAKKFYEEKKPKQQYRHN